jgi:two-component system sensor histidine kinase CpxA
MKLFWKLFVTLGLAITVAMVAAVSLGYYSGQLTFQQGFQLDFEGREPTINRAAVALNSGGREGLTNWLRENQTPVPGRTIYIVDDRGQDLLGRELSDPVRFFLYPRGWDNRGPDSGDDETRIRDGNDRRGGQIMQPDFGGPRNRYEARYTEVLVGPSSETYAILFWRSQVTLIDILNLPATRVGVVTLAIIMAALTALMLAKSLSSPIVRLQRATRGLAAGALETRVGKPIVERKDEVGTLARDFDTMADKIQALITDKETLLRDVSHELRSPLARIRVALALAERKADIAAQADLGRIEQETEKLDQLVGHILTLARLRSSPLEQFVDVDLDQLLTEVVNNARFENPENKITCETGVVPTIQGNSAELASAVENVLRNALLHSGPRAAVAVDLRQRGGEITITVSDNGPGVPEEQLERLFEPFYRVDPSRDHKTSGYGIGLAIASSVIKRHGGKIVAHNRPEGGLAVTFTLPVARGH